jgi:hypothetical protein
MKFHLLIPLSELLVATDGFFCARCKRTFGGAAAGDYGFEGERMPASLSPANPNAILSNGDSGYSGTFSIDAESSVIK